MRSSPRRQFGWHMKAISMALITSFIAYDISWAYPDTWKNLAVTGLQNKDTTARLNAGLICLEIEKSGVSDIEGIKKWYEANRDKEMLEGIGLRVGDGQVLLVFNNNPEKLAIKYS